MLGLVKNDFALAAVCCDNYRHNLDQQFKMTWFTKCITETCESAHKTSFTLWQGFFLKQNKYNLSCLSWTHKFCIRKIWDVDTKVSVVLIKYPFPPNPRHYGLELVCSLKFCVVGKQKCLKKTKYPLKQCVKAETLKCLNKTKYPPQQCMALIGLFSFWTTGKHQFLKCSLSWEEEDFP